MQAIVKKHLQKWLTKGMILGEQESRYMSIELATSCLLGKTIQEQSLLIALHGHLVIVFS